MTDVTDIEPEQTRFRQHQLQRNSKGIRQSQKEKEKKLGWVVFVFFGKAVVT